MPDDYKRELCGIFAAPLGPANTPLCSLLCDSIKEHYGRLHTCVLFELQRFHSRIWQESWARYNLQAQMRALPEGPERSVLFGFMLPLEYWLHTKEFYQNPGRLASDELFVSYGLVLGTSNQGVDYLSLLSANFKTAKDALKMRRK